MGTEKKIVSVIITTCNRPRLLKEAIASVLIQTFSSFELLIIDDASPGTETEYTVASFHDPRITYIKNKKRKGSTESLNTGIEYARGTYIAILDDDDAWISPEKLAKQVDFLETHADHVMVGTGCVVVEYSTEKEIIRSRGRLDDTSIRKNFLLINPLAHSSVLYRKKTADDIGGYDRSLARGKDYDLWLKFGRHGKIAILEECMLKYRESTWKERNIFKLRAIDTTAKIKVVWRHRKAYPHAAKALFIESYRFLIFYSLSLFTRSRLS